MRRVSRIPSRPGSTANWWEACTVSALGRVFFGESMFSRERDASKVAFKQLVDTSLALGVDLIDCQVANPHLSSLGARDLPRREFVARIARAIPDLTPVVGWTQR